jgi:CBS domain-containing protein
MSKQRLATIPEALRAATVLPWDEPFRSRPPRANEAPGGDVRIAHVSAGDHGIEDVEVSVHCPHCDGEILLDVGSEEALHTALSWIDEGRQAEESPVGNAPRAENDPRSGVHRVSTAQIAGLAMHDELVAMLGRAPVREAKNSDVRSVPSGVSLASVARDITLGDASAVVVVDVEGRPLGVVTPTQVLRAASALDSRALEETPVERAMAESLHCLRDDAPLSRALELFSGAGARRIAIIGDDGKLSGVLRPLDLLRFLLPAPPAPPAEAAGSAR